MKTKDESSITFLLLSNGEGRSYRRTVYDDEHFSVSSLKENPVKSKYDIKFNRDLSYHVR